MSNVVLLKPTSTQQLSDETPSVLSTKDKWDMAARASDQAEQLYIEVGRELKAEAHKHMESNPDGMTWENYVRKHFHRSQQRRG